MSRCLVLEDWCSDHNCFLFQSDSYSDLSSENSSSTSGSVSHRFSVPTFPTYAQITTYPITPTTSQHTSAASPFQNTMPSYQQTTTTSYQSPYQPPGGATRPNSIAIMGTISELDSLDSADGNNISAAKPKLFDMRLLRNSLEEESAMRGGGTVPTMLEEALLALRGTLEDYQGRYDELRALEEQVTVLDHVVMVSALFGTSS